MNTAGITHADVVVVGGGGSGLAAAIEAARLGRRVVLLEKGACLGGTTALSVGSVTSSCTALQRKKGIDDSPEAHFEDMGLFVGTLAAKDNLALRRVLVENVPDTIKWLTDAGIVLAGPLPEPPHRVARMHNVLPNSRSYIYHLEKRARELAVDIRLNVRASRLIREAARVTGVESDSDSGPRRFLAHNAVILACGDYSSDPELKGHYVASEAAAIEGINPMSTGDGHRLAAEVGGEVLNGELMLGPEIRFVAPPRKRFLEMIPPTKPFAVVMRLAFDHMPPRLLRPFLMMFVTTNLAPTLQLFEQGAILVNKDGQRFVDERVQPQLAIARQRERMAYILFDRRVAQMFSSWPNFISTAPGVAYAYLPDYRRNRQDIFHEARTIAGLAAALGMAPASLTKTIQAHNRAHVAGELTVSEPPFYALGPVKAWTVLTDGGIRVTPRLEVVDGEGRTIPGLYAAGSTGQGGLVIKGQGHHLGWAFTSGRLAGRYAASDEASGDIAGGERERFAAPA